ARVVVCDDETDAGLVRVAAEAAGILFRLRPSCTESLMARCPKLKVVGRHGVGLDTVDVPAATRLGVAVVHAPGSNSQAVAEHALVQPGAIFVNASRGPVQDERALFEALTRGHLAAAGLDVWEEEPTPVDNPLLNLEQVVCSSHVAGVTHEANRQMAVQVAGEMLRVLRGEKPEVLVNPEVWPRLGRR